jgi:hypothetical protein
MARAREALRHRCDAEEEPMSDLAARFAYSPLLSTAFKVVCLFCVLGLALSGSDRSDDRAGASGLGVVPH